MIPRKESLYGELDLPNVAAVDVNTDTGLRGRAKGGRSHGVIGRDR